MEQQNNKIIAKPFVKWAGGKGALIKHHSPNIKSIFAIYYLNERQVLALLLSFHLIELLLVYCAGAIGHIRM